MEEINFGVKKGTEPKQKKELGFEIIFYALNILAVPFSAIATYNGYKASSAGGPYMAGILAALTALLFFGLNYIIMNRRKDGLPHLKQTLGYFFPLAISFFGNFTYFYGNTVQGANLNTQLTKYSTVLDNTFTNAIATLEDSIGIPKFTNAIDNLDKKLENNYINLGGWGDKCISIWKKIDQHVVNNGGESIINEIPGKENYAKANAIITTAKNSILKSKNNDLKSYTAPIKAIYEPLNDQKENLILVENLTKLKNNGDNLIKDIRDGNSKIISLTQTRILSFKSENLPEHIPINPDNPIKAIEDAWKHKTTSIAPAQSLFFSLIIDLVTLGFIFLAFNFSKKTGKRKGNTGINTLN